MTLPNRGSYRLRLRSRPPQLAGDQEPTRELMGAIKRGRSSAQLQSTKRGGEEATEEMKVEAPGHTLEPLLRKLAALIADPGALLAVLVEELDGVPGDYEAIEARAVAYQRRELGALDEAWQAIRDVAGTARASTGLVDSAMLKTTVYYWRVWEYVSAVCIDAVARMEKEAARPEVHAATLVSSERPSVLAKRRGSSISPMIEARTAESPSSSAKRARLTRQSNEFMIGWFLAHKSNPYPSASERELISERTGLTEQQVRNWFANMRKRHWKPNRPNGKKPRCLLDYVLRSQSS